jgi:8-oxo-(d)GTP phosphatase
MADRQAAEEVLAAGAVLWRPAGRGAQVALIHRPKYDDWTFAKGKVDPGEHVLLAAVREVAEETGLQVTLGRRLRPVRYVTDGGPKRVDYWVAQADPAVAPVTPTSEVDELAWLAAGRASALLSYARDVETLAEFRSGPRRTFPLILVRHASAGRKSDWSKGDQSRPLDSRGRKDASLLAVLLRCFGTCRVISSPAKRCVATVRPYAAGTGGQVEIEQALEVAGGGEASARAHAAKAVPQLAAADLPVVVCAHRENLPVLIEAACAELGAEPPVGRPLRKAEFLVLHRAGGKLAGAERHDPADRG